MPVMLERWNDDKMDALDAKVDDLSSLMREQRQEMHGQRAEFSALQRTMVMATVGILGIFVTGFGILAGLLVGM